MIDSEMIRFIRTEITRQMNVLLYGTTGATTKNSEDIQQMFPDMPTIEARPVVHPYGLVSRAPAGTTSVVGRIGEHTGSRVILGHRDNARPDLNSGEVILYNASGQAVYLENGAIHIGSKASSNPAVLGTELKAMLSELIQILASHTHTGNLGSPTTPPTQAADITSVATNNLDNDVILSDLVFLEKGG